ncbi:thioesterase-like superfamily-domain-containing protein [Mycena crocata]|nr:thioesterase-like superfamily-domain-containing protein [Mycena crocata]
MAPLTNAIVVQWRGDSLADPSSSLACYTANADPAWVVGRVPNGGYLVCLIVQSCIQNQADSKNPLTDPLHVSVHFLQPTKTSTVEVQIRILKRGRNFVNILADLVQGHRTCITAHLIFGKIPPSTGPLIDPLTGYARRYPLQGHPSKVNTSKMTPIFVFGKHVRWAEDPELLSRNEANHPARKTTMGGGLAVWGAWIELEKEERLTPASLAFFTDCFQNMATLFPSNVTGVDLRSLWLPTLTLTLEYKAPIPSPSAMHSARTVGVRVVSGFMSEPQGRHDTFIEIWTAPSGIGEGTEIDGWRDAQVCLGIATQMQLMVKGTVNDKAAAKM